MADIIVTLIIIMILGLSIAYIIKEKKKGVKCIGCPFADSCSKRKKSSGKCGNNEYF